MERIQALQIKQKQQKMEIEIIEKTKSSNTKKQAEKLMKNIEETEKVIGNKIKNTL